MDQILRKSLEVLLAEWRHAAISREGRTATATTVSAATEAKARWRGEAKAYRIGIHDLEALLKEPDNNFDFASEVILHGWSMETTNRLGYMKEILDETPSEEEERISAINTLRECAFELGAILGKKQLDD